MVARHFYAFRALCINSSARTSLLPHRSCAAPIPSEAGQQRQRAGEAAGGGAGGELSSVCEEPLT